MKMHKLKVTPTMVLWCGALILAISLGIRHAFGLFLQPMSMENGWGREEFGFAIALQNLIWGIVQPFVGRIADRMGAAVAIVGGTILYLIGLALMAGTNTPLGLSLTAGVLIGLGLSGTTFPVVFGAISRAVPPEKRSMAMGIAMSVGSLGQFAMLPGSLQLITTIGWSMALIVLAFLSALMAPMAIALKENSVHSQKKNHRHARDVLGEAFAIRDFWLLAFGFFVCGFQVVFIATHLPAYLADRGISPGVATTSLALIGLFNIAGSYLAGLWGGKYQKPKLLAYIYVARAVAIAAFIAIPVSAGSVYVFSVALGFLWLSTVPLTNGTLVTFFGPTNLSMLGGIVFFFHQVGAFMGGWLGGYVFDKSGNYDAVWQIAIALSILAAILNWPIKEQVIEPKHAFATRPD